MKAVKFKSKYSNKFFSDVLGTRFKVNHRGLIYKVRVPNWTGCMHTVVKWNTHWEETYVLQWAGSECWPSKCCFHHCTTAQQHTCIRESIDNSKTLDFRFDLYSIIELEVPYLWMCRKGCRVRLHNSSKLWPFLTLFLSMNLINPGHISVLEHTRILLDLFHLGETSIPTWLSVCRYLNCV